VADLEIAIAVVELAPGGGIISQAMRGNLGATAGEAALELAPLDKIKGIAKIAGAARRADTVASLGANKAGGLVPKSVDPAARRVKQVAWVKRSGPTEADDEHGRE